MNTDLIKSWVNALKSNKYKQGHGVLHRQTGEFCCLGVLCDIVDPLKWVKQSESFNESLHPDHLYWEDNSFFLPDSIASLIDIDQEESELLSTVNDCGKSFEQIAFLIEHMYMQEKRHYLELSPAYLNIPEKTFNIICRMCDFTYSSQENENE